MLKDIIGKRLKILKKSATELCNQVGIPPSTYYLALKKNSLNLDVLAKMGTFLKVPVHELVANTNVPIKARKSRTGISKIAISEPTVVTRVVKKVRKPRKIKTAEITNPVIPEVINIKKRGRRPSTSQPVSANVADNEMALMQMELDYMRQILKVKDELIELLKRN